MDVYPHRCLPVRCGRPHDLQSVDGAPTILFSSCGAGSWQSSLMALSRISVVIPPMGPWSAQAKWYRWADEIGYDVAYTYDHLTHRTAVDLWLGEGFTTLTAAAAATQRIHMNWLAFSSAFSSLSATKMRCKYPRFSGPGVYPTSSAALS